MNANSDSVQIKIPKSLQDWMHGCIIAHGKAMATFQIGGIISEQTQSKEWIMNGNSNESETTTL